jgi:DNA-binding transcriptional LysR family regulator
MEFTQIRYFLAVADCLNFTRAAEKCAVSQPALSKAIGKLEAHLGGKLIHRPPEQVRLTELGQTMRVHFEKIEDSRREAREAANLAAGATVQKLDIGVMCTIGPQRFSTFMAAFLAAHPGLEFALHDVTPAIIDDLLLSGNLDCVLCARSAQHDVRFQARELFTENMVVTFAGDHRFSDMSEVSLEDISSERYLDRLHCELREEILTYAKGRGIELKVAVHSEREDWIVKLVNSGAGVSILPHSLAAANNLQHRPLRDFDRRRHVEVVMTGGAAASPALSGLFDALRDFEW